MELGTEIKRLRAYLVDSYHPSKLILFSVKRDLNGAVTSFKLCVVAEVEDKRELAKRIYLGFDCDVPFDVIIYKPSEWSYLCRQEGSFASKLLESGFLLYEQTWC